MADEVTHENDVQQSSKRKDRGQKGLHRLPLKKALEVAKAVFELGENDLVPRALALEHIGRAAKGGASATLVGASNAYGLTKPVGEKLQITELGQKIVSSPETDPSKRYSMIDALFGNEIFAATHAKYVDRPTPPDKGVLLYLTQTHGLSPSDASVFWETTKTNLSDVGLMRELASGGKIITQRDKVEVISDSKDTAPDNVKDEDNEVQPPTPPIVYPPVSPVSGAQNIVPPKLNPEFHFNIQIHLPPDAEPEQYDAIFKSIGIYLLGRTEE